MSCFPEITYSIYVDDEMSSDERRGVDAHLVGCRSCRVLVSLLRDEAGLLADVLHEREPNWQPASALDDGRSIAVGLPLAIAIVTTLISVVGYLLETRWPGGLSLLNPLRLKGAFELAFDLVFLLRDRVPGLPELALALCSVAALSALLSFGVRVLVSRVGRSASVLLLAVVCSITAEHASALDLRLDQDVEVASDERIVQSLAVSGDQIDIDGIIDGDLVALAERVTIRGTVNGNVYTFTRDLEISGTVTGSVHAGSERTRITGQVGGSVYGACDNFSIGAGGAVGRDVALWVDEAAFDGGIGRDVLFAGRWLEIRGPIGRNVDVRHAERLSLRDGARIGGDVDAVLESDEIEIAAGASIAGESSRVAPEGMEAHMLSHYTKPAFYLFLALRYAAGVLFGILLYAVVPGLFDSTTPTTSLLFRSMAIGFLYVIAAPIVIVCCALTVIGIPIAVVGSFVFLVTLYTAKIAVGALIGRRVMGSEPGIAPFAIALLVGLGLLSVATALPFVGIAIAIVAVLYGLGTIYDRALELRATF